MAFDWGADPSATDPNDHGGSVDPAVDAVLAAAAALAQSDPATLSAAGRAERVRRAEQVIAMVQAQQAACVGVMDARGDAQALGFRSTQAWLRVHAHLAPGAARSLVALARRLPDRKPTHDAFTAGRIGQPHAQILTRTLDEITPHLDGPEHAHAIEVDLVALAEAVDPLTVSRACRRVRIQAAPEPAAAAEWDAYQQRELTLSPTFAGLTEIRGTLDPVSAESVLTAIHAFSAPNGEHDARTPGQRRADALVEVCNRILSTGQAPVTGGERPHINVIIPLATLEERAGAPAAELTWAGPVTPNAVRRLLCDAAVTRILIDAHSQPLDVGGTTRLVPAGLRRAVIIRDRRCQWPGCDVPAHWCDCHHLHHWARGGHTKLSNLIALCGYHHQRLHAEHLAIVRHADGHIELIPDPHHDDDGDHRHKRRRP